MRLQNLICGVILILTLVPWPEIEPRPPALGPVHHEGSPENVAFKNRYMLSVGMQHGSSDKCRMVHESWVAEKTDMRSAFTFRTCPVIPDWTRYFSLSVSTMVSPVCRGRWRDTEGRKGLVFLAPISSGLLFLLLLCGLSGACVRTARISDGPLQPHTKSGHSLSNLTNLVHAWWPLCCGPPVEDSACSTPWHAWQFLTLCACPLSLVYLCPGSLFPTPSGMDSVYPQRGPPPHVCSRTLALLPRGLTPVALHAWHGHHVLQALCTWGMLCAPAQQPWLIVP